DLYPLASAAPAARPEEEKLASYSIRQLANLNSEIIRAEHNYTRANGLVDESLRLCAELEDIQRTILSKKYYIQKGIPPLTSDYQPPLGLAVEDGPVDPESYERISCLCFSSWLVCQWKTRWRQWLCFTLGCVFTIVSLLVIWSECMFSVRYPRLTVLSAILYALALDQNYTAMLCISFILLAYLSVCVFYTLGRFRFFNYYRMVSNHHTDQYSLLFCSGMLCRLAPALCLNFLGLAHLDLHLVQNVTSKSSSSAPIDPTPFDLAETSYTKFMGHLDVIPFIARGFNFYFPIMVFFLCLFTLLRLGDRILRVMGIPELTFDDPDSYDAIREGTLLLQKARMDMKHLLNSQPSQGFLRNGNLSRSTTSQSTQDLSNSSDCAVLIPPEHSRHPYLEKIVAII
ncbi:hypothetical protein Ciccas_013987, partial [Cichlidogyrus casuarinus]